MARPSVRRTGCGPGANLPNRSEHYEFAPIADGVVFCRARHEGTALSNSGIVDLGATTLVFDTSLTLRSARDLVVESVSRTGRSPAIGVNSHWHLDHILGNQLFPEGSLLATRRTAEILRERRADLEAEVSAACLLPEVADLEEKLAGVRTREIRAELEGVVRINRAVAEEAPERRFSVPTRTFERVLTLSGDRSARMMTFGAGHSESDAVLDLPRDRILFAGDLVVGEEHPNMTGGDPTHWMGVLDELDRLRPERIVTGHGRLGARDDLDRMRDYLSTVLEFAREAGQPPLPARFRSWGGLGQYEENLKALRARSASG